VPAGLRLRYPRGLRLARGSQNQQARARGAVAREDGKEESNLIACPVPFARYASTGPMTLQKTAKPLSRSGCGPFSLESVSEIKL
jgi:hypothetical protein